MPAQVRSLAAASFAALLASACAPTLGEYHFESVERVAREAIDAADTFEPKQAPYPWYLRVHFSSKANLFALAEERNEVTARAGLCPLGKAGELAVLGPYSVGQSLRVRARTPEGGVAPGLARVIAKDANGRYAYTAYVAGVAGGSSVRPAYDLASSPGDLCLRLDAEGGPKGPERSNVVVAPEAAVRQALAAP